MTPAIADLLPRERAIHYFCTQAMHTLRLLMKWTASAMAVAIIAWLLPGVHLSGFATALLLAAVLALLNIFVKPFLVLLTIPATIFTLGLFLLVVNALIVLLAESLVPGFEVDGFWPALLFSLLYSLVGTILEKAARHTPQS